MSRESHGDNQDQIIHNSKISYGRQLKEFPPKPLKPAKAKQMFVNAMVASLLGGLVRSKQLPGQMRTSMGKNNQSSVEGLPRQGLHL